MTVPMTDTPTLRAQIRAQLRELIARIDPLDDEEQAHRQITLDWIDSGAPLYRTAKPAVPPRHLVAYFPVVRGDEVLLVDHRNAQRWLPTGGHVEPGEDPRVTVVREVHEELGLNIDVDSVPAPLFITVTETVGLTGGHVDVSLWYPVEVGEHTAFRPDLSEFSAVQWFTADALPLDRCEPALPRFLAKWSAARRARLSRGLHA